MHYGSIKLLDVANGPGIRVSLFVSGCRNHCKGCFQKETWDFLYGKEYTKATEDEIIASLSYPHIKGLTILGGEPFEPENQVALLPLIERVRRELKDKTIWIFSGYRLDDEILKEGVHPNTPISKRIISLIDVLVDGRFIEEKKNISLVFRGSENQRIIDVKKTLNEGKIVLWDERLTKE